MGTKLSINPWTQMWVRPRETIRAIIQSNPGYMYPLLCFIYGFPMALQLAQNFSLGTRFSAAGIIAGALIVAIILGAVMINIATALFTWTGKWIGGVGTYQQIRAAVAWSNMPSVVNIGVWMINIAVFGARMFKSDFVETQFVGNELSIIFFTAVVQLVIAVWAFVITLKALGEVQGFSAWKALLNILIPIFVIFIGVSILAWLFTLMTGTTVK
jgi:hypothetical protein